MHSPQHAISYAWSFEQASDACVLLARHSHGSLRKMEIAPPPQTVRSSVHSFGTWLDAASLQLGIEVDEISAGYADVEAMLRSIGPGIVRIEGTEEARLLAVLSSRGNRVRLLTPSGQCVEVPMGQMRSLLCQHLESTVQYAVDLTLNGVRLSARRRAAAAQMVLDHLLRECRITGCWTFRAAPDRGAWQLLKSAQLPQWLACSIVSKVIASSLFVTSWWLLGGMMLSGQMETSWLIAWGLVLATLVPLNTLSSLADGYLAIAAGTLLKREVLRGAIGMNPDRVRRSGSGTLLGFVMESEIVESASLSGSFAVLHGAMDLSLALIVLVFAAVNPLIAIALIVFLSVIALLARGYYRSRSQWTDMRLGLTSDLIEKLAGFRTRQVQEPRSQWNDGEDLVLEQYLALSKRLDSLSIHLRVLAPRLWLIVGLAALTPSFLAATDMRTISICVGAILLAHRAMRALVAGIGDLLAAMIAWKRVRPFWDAALTPRQACDPALSSIVDCGTIGQERTVLRAKGLEYSYSDRHVRTLQDVDLEIKSGEHVLLQGTSGSGKSTLAAILGGTREPSRGLLLASGLDRSTLGDQAWGKRIVVAPQFHDNHVLSGTLAFNALMGCDWPATPSALAETERVLRGLELGPLLDRMPGRLFQTVGETGWQLSHGERSRLYVARVLLQRPDLVVLDESFGALDAETLEKTMQFVKAESKSLMVIAHP